MRRPDLAERNAARLRSPIDRLLSRVVPAHGGCVVDTAKLNAGGYSDVRLPRRSGQPGKVRGHRLAYEHFVGPIPDGLHLDHLCNNRACVNPHHLEPVSLAENVRRGAERRKRQRQAISDYLHLHFTPTGRPIP